MKLTTLPNLGNSIRFVIITAAILLAGCNKTITSPEISNQHIDTTVSFKNDVQPIFNTSCAKDGCHAGSQNNGMDLTEGNSYSQIVNVPSYDASGYMLVMPFNADSSAIYLKIIDSPIAGLGMPYGEAPLSNSNIKTIRSWIDQGAKNN